MALISTPNSSSRARVGFARPRIIIITIAREYKAKKKFDFQMTRKRRSGGESQVASAVVGGASGRQRQAQGTADGGGSGLPGSNPHRPPAVAAARPPPRVRAPPAAPA